jgi:6-phosphofructokinase 1
MGKAAVEFALAGKSGVMPVVVRTSTKPYRWKVGEATLGRVANREKMMPRRFITKDGFGITPSARAYLEPLIRGEDYPSYNRHGLPEYVRLQHHLVAKKLPPFEN